MVVVCKQWDFKNIYVHRYTYHILTFLIQKLTEFSDTLPLTERKYAEL